MNENEPEATSPSEMVGNAVNEYAPDPMQARIYSAAIVALIIGVVIGLLCRRKEPSLKEKYLEAPLNDLQKAIASLNSIASKKAADGGEAAADLIESLSDKIRSVVKSL